MGKIRFLNFCVGVLIGINMDAAHAISKSDSQGIEKTFDIFEISMIYCIIFKVLNNKIDHRKRYADFLSQNLTFPSVIFHIKPLIIQVCPWQCVYPHTSGSRPNHFHNQLLIIEAFLITNIQKFVYFYDFNENVSVKLNVRAY